MEWVDPGLEALEIAEANFAPEETAHIAKKPAGTDRARAFCTLWTRKEAVAKADGRGLKIPLAEIHVPSGREGLAWIGLESSKPPYTGRTEFPVQELPAPPDFVASLAVKGKASPVRFLVDSSSASHLPGVT